jgi:predicted metal-dependent phosphoesterase TrpH
MGRADLHVHSAEGDGLDSVEAVLEHVERDQSLDIVAITEHDYLTPALQARETAARRGLRVSVVPGMEVTTLDGHLLALFIEEPVASFHRVEETIEDIHGAGGLCIAPHPMTWLTRSLSARKISQIVRRAEGLDGIEAVSCSPATSLWRGRIGRLNRDDWGLPEVGASDAHFKEAVGSAYTEFEGSTVQELRAAIVSGRVRGVAAAYPSLRDIGLIRTLALPITGLRATPKRFGWRRTAWSFVERYAP